MVYSKFSTENAEYVLELENHERNMHDHKRIFEGIDALIIENPLTEPVKKPWFNHSESWLKDLFLSPGRKEIPLYFADLTCVPKELIKDEKNRSDYIMIHNFLGILLCSLPALYISKDKEEAPSILKIAIAFLTYIPQESIIAARNAINARKIEEFIAPELQRKLGKKPKIGMVYGAGHAGLEYDLKYKTLRDLTLWNWRNLNFKRWGNFDRELLDKVYEARYVGLEWKVTEHQTELFK